MIPCRTMFAMLSLLLFCSASPVTAQTQKNLDQQSCAQFQTADRLLNDAYTKVEQAYAADKQFLGKLKVAQRAWLAFRHAELEALYPKKDKQAEYGSVYPMCRCSALQELTETRTIELKRWLAGVKEGDVC